MTNDEAAWETQYLVNRKAELDQGRETLAQAGVIYFDSDGISHGIEQLLEQRAELLKNCEQLENALAFALMGRPLPNTNTIIEAAQAAITKASGWMGIKPDESAD